jgi:murein DD-endopeptidase
MLKHVVLGVIAALLLSSSATAETHSGFPVNIDVGPAPSAVMADGRLRLLYELRLTNFSPIPIDLAELDVAGPGGGALASYQGAVLKNMVASIGPGDEGGKQISIPAGRGVTVFIDLSLERQAPAPAELHHRLSFSYARRNGERITESLRGPMVVVGRAPAVIGPPLRGSGWVAVNGLFNPEHRRAFNAADGQEHLAQRFAIDWVKLGPDGRFFKNDPKSNANYYDYGAEVLAVADGRVSSLTDGLAENAGNNPASERHVTLDNVTGNSIVLDLGHGRFALYAHLQPGSLRVRIGQHVKAGDVLAKLGNTGNSDAPHLHFQLMDANSPLGAEGLPYELASFTELGVVNDPDTMLEKGEAWLPQPGRAPVLHQREFPTDNAVVAFP